MQPPRQLVVEVVGPGEVLSLEKASAHLCRGTGHEPRWLRTLAPLTVPWRSHYHPYCYRRCALGPWSRLSCCWSHQHATPHTLNRTTANARA